MTKRLLAAGAALSFLMASPAWAEWSKLLTPAQLQALMAQRTLDVIDIRAPDAGKDGKTPNFAAGHVPGSVNAPYPSWRGPKENPGLRMTDEALSARLSSAGLEPGTPVVIVYEGVDQTDFGSAARVYWTLKSAGFDEIAILNGGLAEWRKAGLPLSTEATAPQPTNVTARLSDQWSVRRDDIVALRRGGADLQLVDARPTEFYEGKKKHEAAKAAGHVEGAMSAPHSAFFESKDSTVFSPEKVRAWAQAQAASLDAETVVTYCNTGHWAATDWFAISEFTDLPDVRMYPESIVDWTAAGLPVTTGQ